MVNLPFLLSLAAVASAGQKRCRTMPFDNLVAFGDSFTDNGRLGYYISNGGNPPPAGTMHPESNKTASGGLAWGQIAAQYAGSKYFGYAVSGATCSNKIISRYLAPIRRDFPSVMDDEIPSFEADVAAGTLYGDGRTAENTVYALWIGTNDLGFSGAFASDSQVTGTNISSYIDCVWQVFDSLYATGGRRFVLLNTAPLHLLPLYVPESSGGTGNSMFWTNKTVYNETEYQYKLMEYTTTVNTVFDYGVPFQLLVRKRWPGVAFSVFDVHKLLTDIWANPEAYLDAPANSTGYYHHCTEASGFQNCFDLPAPLSSFVWYDELHPAEKTGSIVAKHFIQVVSGNSSYGVTYK